MPTGPEIILTLKVLVTAVTVLFAASLWAIATGRRKLHGRINTVFFVLTLTTVLGFELLIRLGTDITSQFSDEAKRALTIHLYFAVPSALLLPVQLYTGVTHRRSFHIAVGTLFLILWTGTFVTGLFFLPHGG
ncbi:DUF420 domain-containing protein [Fimbriiglobus ruber]|uniref:DUF420 domain-containing protein n=1 Tax=Fimbriiglobus ruber TaxID=1908690 RepID=A0A225DKB7_9BACT|nr:DUF420 domain-containing protein [Fimbriiglobus ruber]OWK37639.1 hypothetical protein FRUB_06759 [Fimbriiglobus ruber]